MIRKFEFNQIYVIESLPSYEVATGTSLFNDLIARRTTEISYLQSQLLTVSNKQEFYKVLTDIQQNCSTAVSNSPLLHLEMHGSKDGLVLASGETVPWVDLANAIRHINKATGHNTLISLATCHGAFFLSAISPSQPAPCFAFIGSAEILYVPDIVESFHSFFDHILREANPQNINLALAVEILNRSITAGRKFHLLGSEAIFNLVMDEYESTLWKPGGLSRRIKELVEDYYKRLGNKKSSLSKNQVKKQMEFNLIHGRHETREKFKRAFLFE